MTPGARNSAISSGKFVLRLFCRCVVFTGVNTFEQNPEQVDEHRFHRNT
jgi:hypothetical protein